MLSEKPLLPCDLYLSKDLLLYLLLVVFMLRIELLLPGIKVLYGDWGEGSEFGSFEDLIFFLNE